MKRRASSQAGLTLVELMVSMVVLGFAIAAAFAIAYTMLNGFNDNKRVLQVERAARGSIEVIGNAIRSTAPGVITGKVMDLADCSGMTTGILVDNGAGTSSSDVLTVVHASGGVLGFLQEDLETGDEVMEVNAADPDFRDTLYFQEGDYVVVSDGDHGHLFKIAGVKDGPEDGAEDKDWILAFEDASANSKVEDLCGGIAVATDAGEPFFSGDKKYPAGAYVIRARRSRFSICEVADVPYLIVGDDDGDCDASDGDFEPIAEGVEDLQVAVGIDVNDDGAITEVGAAADDDEWYYNVAGDSDPTVMGTDAVPNWDVLRLTIVGLTTRDVAKGEISFRPDAEDHAGASSPDAHRRRSLTTVLDLRNIR